MIDPKVTDIPKLIEQLEDHRAIHATYTALGTLYDVANGFIDGHLFLTERNDLNGAGSILVALMNEFYAAQLVLAERARTLNPRDEDDVVLRERVLIAEAASVHGLGDLRDTVDELVAEAAGFEIIT